MTAPIYPRTIPEIDELLAEFDDAQLRYVHWKSNINISLALAGTDDLDLLVHPKDLAICRDILSRRGYILGASAKDRWQRGMWHLYRPDVRSRLMVHVHLHDRLVLGFDFDKNYTLPVVDWYLEDRRRVEKMALPTVDRELIIFVLRTYIKHARSTKIAQFPRALRSLLADRPRELTSSERREMTQLATLTTPHETALALAQSGLDFSADEFAELLELGIGDPSSAQVLGASRLVKARLRQFRMRNEVSSVVHASLRLTAHRFRTAGSRLGLTANYRRRPVSGGRIVALVGGDGAGKSTNVKALHDLLSGTFATRTIHIGRPARTPLGALLGAGARGLSALGSSSLAEAIRHLALAINRRAAFDAAMRDRQAGRFVVLDRLPLQNVTAMDAPRILPGASNSRTLRRLRNLEQRFYSRIEGVDLLVVLKLKPSEALKRRPDDDPKELLRRSGQIWDETWSNPYMVTIDTGIHGRDEVASLVAQCFWGVANTDLLRTELVGQSGVGKSAVSREVAKSLSNATNVLPYWKRPVTLGLCAAMELPKHFPHSKLEYSIYKNMVQLRWFIRHHRQLAGTHGLGATNFVLDQGPFFQLAMGLVEGLIQPEGKLYRRAIAALRVWASPAVTVLNLEEDERLQRLSRRTGPRTRSVELDAADRELLAKSYADAFDQIAEDVGRVVPISTHGDISPVAADVVARLRSAGG